MAASFAVTILAPDRQVYTGRALSLVVPAELGFMGVLAHHAPIVAALRPGPVTVHEETGAMKVLTSRGNGFFEFSGNTATVLLDTAA